MRVNVFRPVQRSLDRFMAEPASIKKAAQVTISATVIVVLAGSIVIWVFDKKDYSSYGNALWFTLQTVTTVGYGDVTPTSAVGRFVGGVVMLTAIGFLTIVTAAITSTFVEAARQRRRGADEAAQAGETERRDTEHAEIVERLDRIEALLAAHTPAAPEPAEEPGLAHQLPGVT